MLRFFCAVGIITLLVVSTGSIALMLYSPHATQPEKKFVKMTKQWTGSVADVALMNDVPAVITDAKALEKLWKAWKLHGKVPNVDFAQELVVTGMTQGSSLNLTPRLDENGNLELMGMGTTDFRLGFRYVIATIRRAGIKTVVGKKL